MNNSDLLFELYALDVAEESADEDLYSVVYGRTEDDWGSADFDTTKQELITMGWSVA